MSLSYKKRYLAYIDFLGFSAAVLRSASPNLGKAAPAIQRVWGALRFSKEATSPLPELMRQKSTLHYSKVPPMVTHFSDTIVISVSSRSLLGLVEIIGMIRDLQLHLLDFGFSSRGAIVKGDLIHEHDLIVGPAMIDAHNMEQSCSIYPRVVLADDIANMLMKRLISERVDMPRNFINFDGDGSCYVDYFNHWKLSSSAQRQPNPSRAQVLHFISVELEKAKKRGDRSLAMKYDWMWTKAFAAFNNENF
jgi:hypothetical protein